MTRAAALLIVLVFAAGCASHEAPPPSPPAPTAPPATETPSAPPPATTTTPGTRPTAPWDTMGTAAGRAGQLSHVYPEGESAIGKKLVDAIPDPSAVDPRMTTSGAAASVPAAAGTTTTPSAPPHSATCWEVQILTTIDKGKAEATRDKARRDLNVSAWIVDDGSFHRVRIGGCLTADGAARLVERVRAEGYPEAFRVMREP